MYSSIVLSCQEDRDLPRPHPRSGIGWAPPYCRATWVIVEITFLAGLQVRETSVDNLIQRTVYTTLFLPYLLTWYSLSRFPNWKKVRLSLHLCRTMAVINTDSVDFNQSPTKAAHSFQPSTFPITSILIPCVEKDDPASTRRTSILCQITSRA